jgi:hypothetical protein
MDSLSTSIYLAEILKSISGFLNIRAGLILSSIITGWWQEETADRFPGSLCGRSRKAFVLRRTFIIFMDKSSDTL